MSLARFTNCKPLQIHRAFTTSRAINRRQSSIYSALFPGVNEATYRAMGQLNKLSNRRSRVVVAVVVIIIGRPAATAGTITSILRSVERVSRDTSSSCSFSLTGGTRLICRDITRSYDRRTIIASAAEGAAAARQERSCPRHITSELQLCGNNDWPVPRCKKRGSACLHAGIIFPRRALHPSALFCVKSRG